MTTLITGGTGHLGRFTVPMLAAAGHDVRVLSRTAGAEHVVADLSTGAGLPGALDGVGTVVHLATTGSAKDSAQTRRLIDAARAASVGHLVFISIVGVDRIPFAYYTDKVVSERLIEQSGMEYTILRATQFHSFVAGLFRPQRRLPVLATLDLSDQPIATEEVATRLTELASGAPAKRVDDIGGPQQLTLRECADQWQAARGTHKPVVTLRIPGRITAAFRAGHHLTALPGYGTRTFADYAREANSA